MAASRNTPILEVKAAAGDDFPIFSLCLADESKHQFPSTQLACHSYQSLHRLEHYRNCHHSLSELLERKMTEYQKRRRQT